MRVVFLDAFPLSLLDFSASGEYTVVLKERSVGEVKGFLEYARSLGIDLELECFVKHRATVDALNRALGLELQPSNGLCTLNLEDTIFVVAPRNPRGGKEVERVSIEDLRIVQVWVLRGCLVSLSAIEESVRACSHHEDEELPPSLTPPERARAYSLV